jgi:RimJ/RimL family protein N-acetyltransferase
LIHPSIETDRLLLRPWRPAEDLDAVAALNADPAVMRWVTPNRPLRREESADFLDRVIRHWDEHGFGLWAAELVGDDDLIGFVGLAIPFFLPAVLPAVEVGWRLRSDVWGRGLATEGGRAALEHGFGPLGLDRIVSIIDPRNTASLRVAEKLGMRLDRDEVDPGTGGVVHIYALDRRSSMAAG